MTETKVKTPRKPRVKKVKETGTATDISSLDIKVKTAGKPRKTRAKKVKSTATVTSTAVLNDTKLQTITNLKAYIDKIGSDIEFIDKKLNESNNDEKFKFKSVIDDLIYLQESNLKLLESLENADK